MPLIVVECHDSTKERIESERVRFWSLSFPRAERNFLVAFNHQCLQAFELPHGM